MANVVTTFQTTVTAVDLNNQQSITRTYTVKLVNGNTGEFALFLNIPIPAVDYNLQVPGSPLQAVSIKNNSATAKLTVKWLPTGGVTAAVAILGPGGMVSYIDPSPAGAGIGITNIALNTDTAGTPVEVYMGV